MVKSDNQRLTSFCQILKIVKLKVPLSGLCIRDYCKLFKTRCVEYVYVYYIKVIKLYLTSSYYLCQGST